MTTALPTHGFSPAAFRAALLVAALAVPTVARADRIDGELLKMTTKLIDRAKESKAKTVGVLKFRGSRDDGKVDFHLGPINSLMADRLENTLVLGYDTDPDWSIDVIRNATAVAAAKNLSYLPAEKAGELFDSKYPLVATGQEVAPDLFFTGVIHFDTKLHTTTVEVQSFTKADPQLRKVDQFTVPTERNTVAEAGRSFVINRALADRDAGPEKDEAKDVAGAGAEKAAQEQQVRKDPTPGVQPAATPDQWVDLRVLYNDEPMNLEPDTRDPGNRAFVKDPKEGDAVKFVLANRSKSRVAVALLVNGFNTIMQDKTEPRYCTKWILAPGKEVVIDGFYTEGTGRNNVRPFRVMSDEASEALFEMNTGDLRNERLGTISLHVFVESEHPAGGDAPITRGLSPLQYKKEAAKIKTIADLKKAMYAAGDPENQNRMVKRGLIADDGRSQDGSRLVVEDFKNATEVQHLLIRYYQHKQN